MPETSDFVGALKAAQAAGKAMAVATVVSVAGSAYRREGTRMLVEEGGATTCMISGGCLEQEVAEIAKRVIQSGTPQLCHFDLDEDIMWGLGLGCGGSINVYIEPVESTRTFDAWCQALESQTSAVLATVIEAPPDSFVPAAVRMLFRAGDRRLGTLGNEELDQAVAELAQEKLGQAHPRAETRIFSLPAGETISVFVDVNVPPPELVVFGAGHDAVPLVDFALRLGFRARVIDARAAFATKERFPGAEVVVTQPSRLAERVPLGKRTYVVIMNHHLERDCACLKYALESSAPYVGVLGPRSRYQRIKDALADEGFLPADEQHVYNPVGLDLGAEPPEEIALSIMAEIVALHKGHSGGFLRDREGGIHQPLRAPVVTSSR